uniref:Histone H2A n=1 Tax=Grammatophora oceanica TaxID=210454 RepID=A0A7S1VWK5_9STRA|mmetsp:Transcript_7902/g.11530  ORF Transcript_7902/g.11530 Transcript_7902/m.11530 type:complete len:472 (+) Transcript_7902:968-2383(+)
MFKWTKLFFLLLAGFHQLVAVSGHGKPKLLFDKKSLDVKKLLLGEKYGVEPKKDADSSLALALQLLCGYLTERATLVDGLGEGDLDALIGTDEDLSTMFVEVPMAGNVQGLFESDEDVADFMMELVPILKNVDDTEAARMNELLFFVFDRIGAELTGMNKDKIDKEDVKTVVLTMIPATILDDMMDDVFTPLVGKHDKKEDKKDGEQTASEKAGLVFPVSLVEQYLNEGSFATTIEAEVPVYLAAVLEYLCGEILKLAGEEALANNNNDKSRISLRHISVALKNDAGFNALIDVLENPDTIKNPYNEAIFEMKQKQAALEAAREAAAREKARKNLDSRTKVLSTSLSFQLDPAQAEEPQPTNRLLGRSNKKEESVTATYATAIYHVLKQEQVHPDLEISNVALIEVDDFLGAVFERIATDAGTLVEYNTNSESMTTFDIEYTALARLGGLADNANGKANTAVMNLRHSSGC